jgi:hypothetical protein
VIKNQQDNLTLPEALKLAMVWGVLDVEIEVHELLMLCRTSITIAF